jgi:hypothetical protein
VNSVKGSVIGTIPPLRRYRVRGAGMVPTSCRGGCAETGVAWHESGPLSTQSVAVASKKGSRPARGGVRGVGSGPASHQKKHQVNASVWCARSAIQKENLCGGWRSRAIPGAPLPVTIAGMAVGIFRVRPYRRSHRSAPLLLHRVCIAAVKTLIYCGDRNSAN